MRVLITGAGGFIGKALVRRLATEGCTDIVAASRSAAIDGCPQVSWLRVGDLARGLDWMPALAGIDVVVHLAGRAHVLKETARDPEGEFHSVNLQATRALAEQCVMARVRRMVLVSSIGVHGDRSLPGEPMRPDSPFAPRDAYARSKLAGERAAAEVAARGSLEITIVRPPLVYGPRAPGNFGRLVRLVGSGIPLPFGAIVNSRSFVSLDNLADFLCRCAFDSRAANRSFVVSDGEDLSTPELLREISAGLGRSPRLLAVPKAAVACALRVTCGEAFAQRLCGTLQVDPTDSMITLGWRPPVGARHAIREAAAETAH